jgi:hypothetical protein
VTLNKGYLPLTTRALRDWCTWVRGGTATVNRVPPSLILRLIKEHGKRVGRGPPQHSAKAESSPAGVNLYFSGVGVGGGGGVEARLFR